MAAEKVGGKVEAPAAMKVSASHIIILVLVAWLGFVWGEVSTWPAGALQATITGTWLPWFYIMLLAAIIGKKTVKVIDKTLLVAIIFTFAILTGKAYYFAAVGECNFYYNLGGTFAPSVCIGAWPPEASQYLKDLLPSWLVAWDPLATDRYYRGGGEPIWGPMIAPIVTWSVIYIAIAFQMMFLTFAIVGPGFWETMRMPFPITIPSRFVINNVCTEDPKQFGDLFFNIRKFRVFWVGVLIGALFYFPIMMQRLFPGPAWQYWAAYINIETIFPGITNAIRTVFPNAIGTAGFTSPALIMVFALVPYSVATASLFWHFITCWLYPGVATRLGLIPAGASVVWGGPIKIGAYVHNWTTLCLALGLIALYALRGRIAEFVNLVRVNGSIGGVSARVLLGLFIISTLLFLSIWSAAGLDPLTNFLLWLLYFITSIGGAYFYAGVLWMGGNCKGYQIWWIPYTIGAPLGLLPTTPTPGHRAAAVFGYYTAAMGTCVGAYDGNCMYNATILASTYSLGAGTKVDMRRLFIYMLVVLMALPPFAFAFDVWFNSHVGVANTAESGMIGWNPAEAALDLGVRSITWGAPPVPVHEAVAWQIGWALFIFACYFITARFPLLDYFLNPLGMTSFSHTLYFIGWFNPLMGLILKYLLTRVFGAKRAYDAIVEFASGFAVGFSLLFIVMGAYVFFSISLPTIAAYWR